MYAVVLVVMESPANHGNPCRGGAVIYQGPNSHRTHRRKHWQMEPAVLNGCVHTGCKQRQRNCPQICWCSLVWIGLGGWGKRQVGKESWYLEGGIAGLDLELGQHPDAVRQLHRLVQHVLPLDVPLRDREHVIVAQLLRNRVCNTTKYTVKTMCTIHKINQEQRISVGFQEEDMMPVSCSEWLRGHGQV